MCSDVEAFLLYCLGPDYIGSLKQINLSSFQIYDVINEQFIGTSFFLRQTLLQRRVILCFIVIVSPFDFLELHKKYLDILLDFSKYPLFILQDRIVFIFCAKRCLFGTQPISDLLSLI